MNDDNLLDILYSEKELVTGMIVGSQLIKELEIYGFIPYAEDADFDVNFGIPLDMRFCTIASDRILFSFGNYTLTQGVFQKNENITLPIYRKLRHDNTEHELLLENLYVFSLRSNSYYKEFRKRKLVNLNCLKKASSQISINNFQTVYYKTKPDEILMYKKCSLVTDNVSAVSSSFFVVCRFVSSITGGILYVIYPPEDLFLLAKKK